MPAMAILEKKTQAGFPACINLTIEFNPFAPYYQTVEQSRGLVDRLHVG